MYVPTHYHDHICGIIIVIVATCFVLHCTHDVVAMETLVASDNTSDVEDDGWKPSVMTSSLYCVGQVDTGLGCLSRQRTTLELFCLTQSDDTEDDPPPGFKKIVVKHNWPDIVTLEDVEMFRRRYAHEYNLLKCAMMLHSTSKSKILRILKRGI